VRLAGGLILMWIAVKLLLPEANDGTNGLTGSSTLLSALKTIAAVNLVRSIDNIIGVAAAADGNLWLLLIGLVISMPVLCYGSVAIVALVERFRVLTILGAAFIGFLAGDMIASDAVVELWFAHHLHIPGWHTVVAAMSAVLVVVFGKARASMMLTATVPRESR